MWKFPTGVLLMHAIYFNKFLRFWHSGTWISITRVNLSPVGDTSSAMHGTTISDHFLSLLTSHCKELNYQAMCSFACLFLTLCSASIFLLSCLKDHRWQSCWLYQQEQRWDWELRAREQSSRGDHALLTPDSSAQLEKSQLITPLIFSSSQIISRRK